MIDIISYAIGIWIYWMEQIVLISATIYPGEKIQVCNFFENGLLVSVSCVVMHKGKYWPP